MQDPRDGTQVVNFVSRDLYPLSDLINSVKFLQPQVMTHSKHNKIHLG